MWIFSGNIENNQLFFFSWALTTFPDLLFTHYWICTKSICFIDFRLVADNYFACKLIDLTLSWRRSLAYRNQSPPRLKLTLLWWGGFPPRSFYPCASTRRAQLSVAAKVVRPTDLLKNVRYWFIID